MTISPVAKISIVRTILAIVASYLWPLYHFDVKNAFLHFDLKEVVYMCLPQALPGVFTGDVALF